MSDKDRSELVQDVKNLFDRLEDEIDELADGGKEGINTASQQAKNALDAGSETSKQTLEEIRNRLDEIEDEMDDHIERGKEATADTVAEIRSKLQKLEARLRN